MRSGRVLAILAVVALAASTAAAQTETAELTPAQVAVACAPPPRLGQPPADILRIVGSQDAAPRTVFGRPELLVVSGGTARGVQTGQRYFVRRLHRFGSARGDSKPHVVHTAGWIRVIAVNETTALASVDRICDDIMAGDYLEPFEVPLLPADITAVDTTTSPDFSAVGRVLFGPSERETAAVGEFVLIDRGAQEGIEPGMQFAVYRDHRLWGVPLAPVGEAQAVSVGERLALVRINRARGAIVAGDFVVPRSGPALSAAPR
jgi:hypothetical protein